MIRRVLCAALLLVVPLAGFAALSLDEARAQGLVGEDWTGYVAPISAKPSTEILALVSDVNAKRHAVYADIARKSSTSQDPVSVDDVGRLSAGKLFDKSPPGTYIRTGADQPWTKK